MLPKIFISYKSEEYYYADKVRYALEQSGISCWMAPDSIPGGASYATEIPRAINQCKAFVLILTDKSQNSKWVPRELDRAINAGKVILPFMPEKMKLNDDITFYLTNVQMYMAYDDWDRELSRLIKDAGDVVGIKPKIPSVDDADTVQKTGDSTSGSAVEPPSVSDIKPAPIKKRAVKQQKNNGRVKKVALISSAAVLTVALVIGIAAMVSTIHRSVADSTDQIATLESSRKYEFKDGTITAEDILALADNKNLTELTFTGSAITQDAMGQLSVLNPKITKLTFENCKGITDYSIISKSFSSLYTLTIKNCGLNDTGLQTIDFSCLTHLSTLDISENEVEKLDALTNASAISKLYVNGNKLTSLHGLETAIRLERLNCSDNSLTDISALSNCTILEYIDLNNNHIEDMSVLGKSSAKLIGVYFNNNQVKELSFLKDAAALKYLSFDNNQVEDLSPLKGSVNVTSISAEHNKIKSISALSAMKALSGIDLSHNEITDISPVAGINGYENSVFLLDLSHNKIDKIVLNESARYKKLYIYDNPISDYGSLYTINYSYIYFSYSTDIDYDKLAQLSFLECNMTDCPLDQQVHIEEVLGSYRLKLITQKEADEYTASVKPSFYGFS